jgi:hypothetical protein
MRIGGVIRSIEENSSGKFTTNGKWTSKIIVNLHIVLITIEKVLSRSVEFDTVQLVSMTIVIESETGAWVNWSNEEVTSIEKTSSVLEFGASSVTCVSAMMPVNWLENIDR